jgi:hypothetical protein
MGIPLNPHLDQRRRLLRRSAADDDLIIAKAHGQLPAPVTGQPQAKKADKGDSDGRVRLRYQQHRNRISGPVPCAACRRTGRRPLDRIDVSVKQLARKLYRKTIQFPRGRPCHARGA